MPTSPEKPALLSRTTGVCAIALAAASMVSMASDVKLALSMRIARQGDHAKVAFAAEVSVVADHPCAVDGCPSTVGICMNEGPERRINGKSI